MRGRGKGLNMAESWEHEIKVMKTMTDTYNVPEILFIVSTCKVMLCLIPIL